MKSEYIIDMEKCIDRCISSFDFKTAEKIAELCEMTYFWMESGYVTEIEMRTVISSLKKSLLEDIEAAVTNKVNLIFVSSGGFRLEVSDLNTPENTEVLLLFTPWQLQSAFFIEDVDKTDDEIDQIYKDSLD